MKLYLVCNAFKVENILQRNTSIHLLVRNHGECEDCGYQIEIECEHTDTSRIQLGSTSYNQISGDDVYHEVEKHYKVTCDDCGETVDNDEEEYDEEKHSFDKYQLYHEQPVCRRAHGGREGV